MAEKKQSEKETKKIITEDVERFFRDVWGKVVEYASMGAEEATKMSATAKTRVDIETLKFKRGKIIKMLGERYWDLCDKEPGLAVAGTKEILRQIKGIDNEIASLEKELDKTRKTARKAPPKKAQAKKSPPRKAPAKKSPPKKKTAPKSPSEKGK